MIVHPPQTESAEPFAPEVFIGDGPAVQKLRLQVARIAPHFRTALLIGESGVGKRTIAREMHRLSPVASGPFHSRQIDEFASAREDAMGRGTLFLQGIERLQPALQEKAFDKLKSVHRETRVIVASECDLKGMVAAGRMRGDLHGRLGTLEIRVTPLMERTCDLEPLLRAMLGRLGNAGTIGTEILNRMQAYHWPGNLQELWQLAERVAEAAQADGVEAALTAQDLLIPRSKNTGELDREERLEVVMQRHVMDVLQRCAGNKLKTAELLGISRSTLYRMLESAPSLA